MTQIFIIQLIASVIIGGLFVAIQSLLAERAPQRVAGILLSIPSTLAIGLIFIALSISSSAVAGVVAVIPASFGVTLVFIVAYVYLANVLRFRKMAAIIVSTIGAILTWLLLAVPFAYFQINNLALSLSVYAILVLVSHYFLAIRPTIETKSIHIRYTVTQKIMRAVIGGAIIGLIVFLSKSLGPFWGAVFTAFPAVYLSTLLIVHYQHGKNFLFHIARALPIASPIFIIYALVAQYTYPRIGIGWGTVAAYAASIPYSIIVALVLNKKRNT